MFTIVSFNAQESRSLIRPPNDPRGPLPANRYSTNHASRK